MGDFRSRSLNKSKQRYFLFPPFFAPQKVYLRSCENGAALRPETSSIFLGEKKRVAVECRADTKLPPSPKTLFSPRRRSNKNFGHREGHSVTQKKKKEKKSRKLVFSLSSFFRERRVSRRKLKLNRNGLAGRWVAFGETRHSAFFELLTKANFFQFLRIFSQGNYLRLSRAAAKRSIATNQEKKLCFR